MIIQIDIDGTIDRHPVFFSWMTKSLRRDGHRVLIASSRSQSPANEKATAAELAGWEITYDELHLSPDFSEIAPRLLPADIMPAHRIYAYKLVVARGRGCEVLFDDCGITADLFRKHLPHVQIFRPLR